MPDTYWLLDRGTRAPAIPIDYTSQANPWPTPRRGQADPYDCRFVPNPPTDYSTLSTDALTGHQTRYEAVRDYLQFSHAVEVDEALLGGYWFDEYDVSDASPVATHFVRVRPPDSIDVPDFYAAVTGGDVTKSAPNPQYRIELELTYLAEASDYTTRSAARQNLEA